MNGHSPRFRTVTGCSTLVLLVLCGGLTLVFWQQIGFYLDLYRVHRTAQGFYAEYEHLTRDIVFDPSLEPRLDVYAPATGVGHPVVIFVHGGSWKDYDKVLFAPVALKLLPEEFVVVIPDYTLHPDADYEQMAREVASALSWTLENIEQYGGDPEHVVMAGHSAGGHLLALAVMDPRFLAEYGHSSGEVCGLVGLSGVYDIQAEYAFWQAKGVEPKLITEVMNGPESFERASPISYARADLPPVLLIHGDEDKTVPVEIAKQFDRVLRAAGAQSELVIYPGAGHSDYLVSALSQPRSPLVADIADFSRGCGR